MKLNQAYMILVLWIGLVSPQSYDTYSFFPSSLYIDPSNNLLTTGVSILKLSDDHLFMAVKGVFAKDILMIYYKGSQGY
jgi:hypothetical protein